MAGIGNFGKKVVTGVRDKVSDNVYGPNAQRLEKKLEGRLAKKIAKDEKLESKREEEERLQQEKLQKKDLKYEQKQAAKKDKKDKKEAKLEKKLVKKDKKNKKDDTDDDSDDRPLAADRSAGSATDEAAAAAAAAAEDESLLSTLVESDYQLEASIKAVFEAGKEQAVLGQLDNFIGRREKDIEEICSSHYQEFIASVDGLLQVRAETTALREAIGDINADLQDAAASALGTYQQLYHHRRMRLNMARAVELINDCQYILGLLSQMNEFVASGEYYMALKIVDQLERVHLPPLADYSFVQYLVSTMPQIKDKIVRTATNEFNGWFYKMREQSGDVGSFAIDQTSVQLRLDEQLQNANKAATLALQEPAAAVAAVAVPDAKAPTAAATPSRTGVSAYRRRGAADKAAAAPVTPLEAAGAAVAYTVASIGTPIRDKTTPSEYAILQENLFANRRYTLDFLPLYRCLHVYKTLARYDQFQTYYRDNRRLQANIVLRPSDGMSLSDELDYQAYLHKVAGFFIVEDRIAKTADELMHKPEVAKMWTKAVVNIKAWIQEQLTYGIAPAKLIVAKDFLYAFSKTLQAFGFEVDFQESFELMREKFSDGQVSDASAKFEKALEPEQFENMVVSDGSKLEALVFANQLNPSDSRSVPQTLPFSRQVPYYCSLVKECIGEFHRFAKNVLDVAEFVRKMTERTLHTLNQLLVTAIDKCTAFRSLSVGWLDLHWLEHAAVHDWQPLIGRVSYSRKVRLVMSFDKHRRYLEAAMADMVRKRIAAAFLAADATIAWTSSSARTEPRQALKELKSYLDETFAAIYTLPAQVIEDMLRETFKTLSTAFVSCLLVPSMARFNSNAVRGLDADLRLFESLAAACKLSSAPYLLLEPRQVFDLMLADNPEDYADASIRKQRYSSLNDTGKLLRIVEQFKEDSKWTLRKRTPTDKHVEALVTTLRSWHASQAQMPKIDE
eukprot:TRINITY_DN579_c0_g2_i1.p1 TRINITY_DN579_c0_g2~~TRINITY_DN579_c0_g2_i1.p1  ORF type:complete len:959 (+),score=444.50 TRINITY_DN579_c0_g2_i1:761-3637(+)